MAWEKRASSRRRYYYRSVRTVDGKVMKEYCGSGERAATAFAVSACLKQQREADQQAVRDEQARLAGPAALTAEFVQFTQLMLEATLLMNGYHRLNYGKWRKRHRDHEQ